MKPTILFLFEHKYEDTWKDGLWAALEVLKQDFTIIKVNHLKEQPANIAADFILGWGAFNSPTDVLLQSAPTDLPKGLCVAGNTFPSTGKEKYNVLFYETNWTKNYVGDHPNLIHAFGVNTDLYWHNPRPLKIWDYLTIGSFSLWKRQGLLSKKPGVRMAVGEIQKENFNESLDIIANLLLSGVGVSDMVPPERLAKMYHATRKIYIPADINGGGERAILEARACGIPVEIEKDNPKLQELLTGEIYDHHYYANQLKLGILSCL